MTLADQAATFLEADGWTITRQVHEIGLLIAKRAGFGDASDQVIVWCPSLPSDPQAVRRYEPTLRRRFVDEARTPGQKFLLVDSREGLSNDFQREARRDYNINIRVPIQFFDAPFKWDSSTLTSSGAAAATAAGALRQRGEERARGRTPQPFHEISAGDAVGKDLLAELRKRFESTLEWSTPVILVTAPAGFGKSVLFESLYSRLYEDFMTAKRELRIARRPLPLLPEYVGAASAPTLRGVVEAFLQADVARPVRLQSFEWMLQNGYASWVLDGLDEVISQDPNFFEYILDVLTRPNSPSAPRILICVRDSLLSASPGLRDFVAEAGNLITEFRLLPWQRESLDTFARMRLPSESESFLKGVTSSPTLEELCGTPYYAELVASRVESGAPTDFVHNLSEIDLLDNAVAAIIDREFDKGLMSRAVLSTEDVLELVRDVAVMELQSTTRGVSIEEISELAAILLPTELDDSDRANALSQMQHLSVFRSTTEQGQVRFAQDVIFEFLVGRRAVEWLRSNPSRFVQLLGWRPLPPDSLVLRVLKAEIESRGGADDIHRHLIVASASPTAFRNLLQLILLLDHPSELLRAAPLERQDLSGIRFTNLELADISLRGANLESAHFSNCDLAGLNVAEATLNGTRFEKCRGFPNADFGSLSGFINVWVDALHIDSVEEFLGRVRLNKTAGEVVLGPCPTAMQVRSLFLKFIRPDGQARRDWLDERAVLAGKRYVDPSVVVDAVKRAGFLTWDAPRRRYERNRGELYADMVGFIKNLQVTSTIGVLLQETCREAGCAHLVEVSP